MSADSVLLAARLLMSLMFFAGGWSKLAGDPGERQAIAALGLPLPGVLERLTGLLLLAGALALVSGVYIRLAALLLALFVAIVTALFMRFWWATEPQQRSQLAQGFLANLAVMGGLLALAVIGPGALALMPGS